jgi:hypothetical protein
MTDKSDIFQQLVLTLESSERQEMLRRLADDTERQISARATVAAEAEGLFVGQHQSPDTRLREESFIVRLWYIVCAFFSSSSATHIYSAHLVSELGRNLSRNYSEYINIHQKTYTSQFYRELLDLRKCQSFFSSLLSAYEDNKGDFYIILGTLLMKETSIALASSADPFTVPVDKAPPNEIRTSLLRGMDAALQGITEEERTRMYQAVQGIEWIRNFCELPLDRMILRFSAGPEGTQECMIESIGDETRTLVNTLSGGKRIPVLLMEAMHLFDAALRMGETRFDFEQDSEQFMTVSTGNLELVRQFKSRVPLADFVRFNMRDVSWEPFHAEGGEDWFLLFKNAWKKRFDEKMAAWNRLNRNAMLRAKMLRVLDLEELPTLLYHPWSGLWLPLEMRRETSIAFLKGLFRTVYPALILKPLKILLIEGDFYRRENLAEYTDSFNMLEHMQQFLETFETRLSPKGDIGESFALVQKECVASVKGKARLENLMLTVDSDADSIINRALGAFRSLDLLLGGILGLVRGGPYETLINVSAIQGKLNERFRKDLTTVRQLLQDSRDILEESGYLEKDRL